MYKLFLSVEFSLIALKFFRQTDTYNGVSARHIIAYQKQHSFKVEAVLPYRKAYSQESHSRVRRGSHKVDPSKVSGVGRYINIIICFSVLGIIAIIFSVCFCYFTDKCCFKKRTSQPEVECLHDFKQDGQK